MLNTPINNIIINYEISFTGPNTFKYINNDNDIIEIWDNKYHSLIAKMHFYCIGIILV